MIYKELGQSETSPLNKRAFTLLETLVILAILGIFIAVLIPAMGRARESARVAQCANNLRQIGVAWILYLDEHDEKFPTSFIHPDRGDVAWGGKIGNQTE